LEIGGLPRVATTVVVVPFDTVVPELGWRVVTGAAANALAVTSRQAAHKTKLIPFG
jgi:hypothetical protein